MVIKAINKAGHVDRAAKLLGVSPTKIYDVLRINRITMLRNEKNETYVEKGQEVVEMGDLGYWPSGRAFCIFFGPTPMSRGEEIRPASAVTVFGKVVGDAAILKRVDASPQVTIERKTE